MSLHTNKDIGLITQAYSHVIASIPEPSPRTVSRMQERGRQVVRRYIDLDLKPCHRINHSEHIELAPQNVDVKPNFHTISTNEDNLAPQVREQRNPYQTRSKINYFQSAMRNVNINSALADRNENKKKLKTFVKNSTTKVEKFRKIKQPSRQTPKHTETSPTLVVSQSAKHQVSLKSELEGDRESMRQEILKLHERVKKLEKENKKLKEENRKLKARPGSKIRKENRPPGSHYKGKCHKAIHHREHSRTSTGQGFSHTDMMSDVTRSYSFENPGSSKGMQTEKIDPGFLKSYNNYVPIPHKTSNKENFENNIKVEKALGKTRPNESILMQKVSRILEKRELNKLKYTPREEEDLQGGRSSAFQSLKHSKNEIIARINNKYGNRMQ